MRNNIGLRFWIQGLPGPSLYLQTGAHGPKYRVLRVLWRVAGGSREVVTLTSGLLGLPVFVLRLAS